MEYKQAPFTFTPGKCDGHKVRQILLEMQDEIDRLTERLKRPNIHDHDYWDGYNDALISAQARLEKAVKL